MLEYEDDVNILINNKKYDSVISQPLNFTYDFSDDSLKKLRTEYKLEKIAGNGSEFIRLLRTTFWVSSTLSFGKSNLEPFDSLKILELTGRGLKSNCFVAATVLAECFLSLGFKARMIRCMPLDLRFNECHCMTIAYLQSLNKFVAFDPAMGGCYTNNHGDPMSILEIRDAIINDRDINIRSIFPNIDIAKVKPYLAKNLVRFQSHKDNKYGCELNQPYDIMINLNPITLQIKNKIAIANQKKIEHIFIYNENIFWECQNQIT